MCKKGFVLNNKIPFNFQDDYHLRWSYFISIFQDYYFILWWLPYFKMATLLLRMSIIVSTVVPMIPDIFFILAAEKVGAKVDLALFQVIPWIIIIIIIIHYYFHNKYIQFLKYYSEEKLMNIKLYLLSDSTLKIYKSNLDATRSSL